MKMQIRHDVTYQTVPGPRQIAVLEHAKLISHAEVEFEESARHPHNRLFSIEKIARVAVNEYGTLAADAAQNGRVKMAAACATVAVHFATKYNVQPEVIPGFRHVYAITDGDGITRQLSRPVRVF